MIPAVLAFALSGVYTIVDGLFIGRSLGDIGLAAIALGFPIAAFIQAVGTGVGLAGGIHYTIFGAQNDEKKQQNCFSGTALLLLLLSVLLTAVFFFFAKPLLRLLGAKGEVLAMAAEYVRVIALGAIFQMLATGFVPFIRNMGGATFAMVAMILGFVTNIILDYAFVWVLPWGMAGAAWATIIGQAVTMLAAVLFFVRKKRRIGAVPPSRLPPLWGTVLKFSLSPFGLTYSSTITLLLMNRFLLIYGNEQSVAIYSCISYITAIIYLLLQGVGDGRPADKAHRLLYSVCHFDSLRSGGLFDPHENRVAIRRIRKRKRRRRKVSAVFPCNRAASVVCPHHDLLFLRNGKGSPVLSSGLCRAGLYACASADLAACAEADRRVGGNSCGAGMRLCHCGHRKAQESFHSSVIATALQYNKKQAPPEGLFCCTHQDKTFFDKLSR